MWLKNVYIVYKDRKLLNLKTKILKVKTLVILNKKMMEFYCLDPNKILFLFCINMKMRFIFMYSIQILKNKILEMI